MLLKSFLNHCDRLLTSLDILQVNANGFSFRTLAQPDSQHLDAIGFTVAVCNKKGSPLDCAEQDWKVVGSSRCLWTVYDFTCINVKDGIYQTSLQRHFLVDCFLCVVVEIIGFCHCNMFQLLIDCF